MVDDKPSAARISRRTMIRRSAIVGGALVWAAPVVESLAPPAFAAGSPPPCSNPCTVSIDSCQTVSGAATITAGDSLRIDYNFDNAPSTGTVEVTNAYLVLWPYTGGAPSAGACSPAGGLCGSVKLPFPDETFTMPCGSTGCHETVCTTAPSVPGCPDTYEVAFQFFATVCGGTSANFKATLSFDGYHGTGTTDCSGLTLGSYSATAACAA